MTLPEEFVEVPQQSPASPSGRDHAMRNWTAVVALAVIALLAFAALGQNVLERETSLIDIRVRDWVHTHQTLALIGFAQWLSKYGSVTPLILVAITAALYLLYHRRYVSALPVLVAPVLGVEAYATLKHLFARARPSELATALEGGTYSFPSAHATSSSAICCTLAYVFWRERLVNDTVALAFGILVPLCVGLSRIYLDVHWTTDVLGGWSAGILVAALSAALYNSIRHMQARRQSTGEGN